MRNLNQLPTEISGNVGLNPFLMAKTGQLSLMQTVGAEMPTTEPQASEIETEQPAEQAA